MVAVLPNFLICTHLHCFPFMTSNPLPALHSFAPIVSPILRDSPPLPLSYWHRSIPPFTPVSLLSRFLPLSYSFPCTPISQFSLVPLLQFSSQLSLFPCLTAFLSPLSYSFPCFPFLTCIDPFSCYGLQVALVMCTFC